MLAFVAGVLDGKDLDFKLHMAVVDKFCLGRWHKIHFFNEVHVQVSKHRSGSTSVKSSGNTKASS